MVILSESRFSGTSRRTCICFPALNPPRNWVPHSKTPRAARSFRVESHEPTPVACVPPASRRLSCGRPRPHMVRHLPSPVRTLTACQAPCAKINLAASRKSFFSSLLSLFSDFPKFADYFSKITTLVLYAANLPTRQLAPAANLPFHTEIRRLGSQILARGTSFNLASTRGKQPIAESKK